MTHLTPMAFLRHYNPVWTGQYRGAGRSPPRVGSKERRRTTSAGTGSWQTSRAGPQRSSELGPGFAAKPDLSMVTHPSRTLGSSGSLESIFNPPPYPLSTVEQMASLACPLSARRKHSPALCFLLPSTYQLVLSGGLPFAHLSPDHELCRFPKWQRAGAVLKPQNAWLLGSLIRELQKSGSGISVNDESTTRPKRTGSQFGQWWGRVLLGQIMLL